MEAGVVIVPTESLRIWASVCLACLFQVGLKDVTTKSATKRSVSTVTDTPLLFPHCMFFLTVALYEEPLCFPFSFLQCFGQPYFYTCCSAEKWSACKPWVVTCNLAGFTCLAAVVIVLLLCGLWRRSLCY